MSNSNYPGIDYSGPGSTTNRDAETGIRYGVISQHSIHPDVMSDIWQGSRDLSYEAAVDKMKSSIRRIVHEPPSDWGALITGSDFKDLINDTDIAEMLIILGDGKYSAEEMVEACWDLFEHKFNYRYESGDSHDWLWEERGYQLSNCLQSDVFVTKSPYFTYAQFCSPCVPGAGNLDNPFEGLAVPKGDYPGATENWHIVAAEAGYPKVFCLGHNFFEDEKAPYEVFSVATGKRVVMKLVVKSVAKWPDGVGINLGNQFNTSEDTHGDVESAKAVCAMLEKNGFGGDGLVFPVWTQVRQDYEEVEQ
jgi:hypothetical protein